MSNRNDTSTNKGEAKNEYRSQEGDHGVNPAVAVDGTLPANEQWVKRDEAAWDAAESNPGDEFAGIEDERVNTGDASNTGTTSDTSNTGTTGTTNTRTDPVA